jgi:hypothetical protein
MRFTGDQHSEMAERLQERASKNPDPVKAQKQAAMAITFRLLARRAVIVDESPSQALTR